jgi:1-deoxy-D-xylulose-5-phosphate synthase
MGKAELRREGPRGGVAILVFGSLLAPALEAAGELDATVANMRFVKPIDQALVVDLAAKHDLLVTVEENAVMGGAGSAVAEVLAAQNIGTPLLQLGFPDRFIDHGDQMQLLASIGLDQAGIVAAIRARLG